MSPPDAVTRVGRSNLRTIEKLVLLVLLDRQGSDHRIDVAELAHVVSAGERATSTALRNLQLLAVLQKPERSAWTIHLDQLPAA